MIRKAFEDLSWIRGRKDKSVLIKVREMMKAKFNRPAERKKRLHTGINRSSNYSGQGISY
jgi:hypothetical protein